MDDSEIFHYLYGNLDSDRRSKHKGEQPDSGNERFKAILLLYQEDRWTDELLGLLHEGQAVTDRLFDVGERQLIQLKVEGYKDEEVRSLLGYTYGSYKTRKSEVKKKLRMQFKGRVDNDIDLKNELRKGEGKSPLLKNYKNWKYNYQHDRYKGKE